LYIFSQLNAAVFVIDKSLEHLAQCSSDDTIWSVTDFDLGFKLDKHPRPCYAVSVHNLHGLRCSSSLNTSISVGNYYIYNLFVIYNEEVFHLNEAVFVIDKSLEHLAQCSSDDTICPGHKTRANAFDK
jgi:hypothetical protein